MQFQTATKPERVSDRIIDQVRDAVLSGRLKPGDRLASEKELVAQFGVSKGTMREALRVLEAMGLVEIRQGIGGGVFISEVEMKTTIHGIMNFLHFKSVSIKEITMVRFMLEPWVAHMAALSMTDRDRQRLEQMIEGDGEDLGSELTREIGFHRYLARMTQNPILILIMDFLDSLVKDFKIQLDLDDEFFVNVRDAHRSILECLVRRDAEAARREITQDLLEVGDYLSKVTGKAPFDPAEMGFTDSSSTTALAIPATGDQAAALVQAGVDPELCRRGLLVRKVGSGDLYMLVPRDDETEE